MCFHTKNFVGFCLLYLLLTMGVQYERLYQQIKSKIWVLGQQLPPANPADPPRPQRTAAQAANQLCHWRVNDER